MKPTKPQAVIMDYIFGNPSDNIMVMGVPGAGKTALLSMIVKQFQTLGVTDVLALTFSKDLSEAMLERLEGAKVSTTHAYMFQALKGYLRLHNKTPQLFKKHGGKTFRSYVDEDLLDKELMMYVKTEFGITTPTIPAEVKKEFFTVFFDLKTVVNKIRQGALNYKTEVLKIHETFDFIYGVQTVNDALIVLETLSNRFFQRAVVDFNGMLYLPLIHAELAERIVSPEILLVDETNDTNKLLEFSYRCVGRNSRFIGVGDKKQTIHIWAGTPRDCMERLQTHFNAKQLSYDFTFRVPKSICRYLNESGIDTRIQPYENNREGEITRFTYHQFLSRVTNGDAVLCRYNRGNRVEKTLQVLSIELLKLKRKVAFHGSTHIEDIQELLGMAQPLPKDFSKAYATVERAVKNAIATEWKDKDLAKDNNKCIDLKDKLSTFEVYFKFYKFTTDMKFTTMTMDKFIQFLESMYEKTDDAIHLVSVHRSKGQEWKTVWAFHIESFVEDVNDLTLDFDKRIEAHNLLLVMLTRSLDRVCLVDCELPQYLPEPIAPIVV